MNQKLTFLLCLGLLLSACSSSAAPPPTSAGDDSPAVIEPSSIPPTAAPLPEQSATDENSGDVEAERTDGLLATFTTVCGGAGGVAQAAAYDPSAISPLVMIAHGGGQALNLSSELPGSWASTDIEGTELVVCIEHEEDILLQTCEYDIGPDVERYQQRYAVTVFEAMTGDVLAEGPFVGALPRSCGEEEAYELERLDGGIDFEPINLWLCQFVDPTCMPREPNGNYIVVEGDTWESIAAGFEVPVDLLLGINGVTADSELIVGTELWIP